MNTAYYRENKINRKITPRSRLSRVLFCLDKYQALCFDYLNGKTTSSIPERIRIISAIDFYKKQAQTILGFGNGELGDILKYENSGLSTPDLLTLINSAPIPDLLMLFSRFQKLSFEFTKRPTQRHIITIERALVEKIHTYMNHFCTEPETRNFMSNNLYGRGFGDKIEILNKMLNLSTKQEVVEQKIEPTIQSPLNQDITIQDNAKIAFQELKKLGNSPSALKLANIMEALASYIGVFNKWHKDLAETEEDGFTIDSLRSILNKYNEMQLSTGSTKIGIPLRSGRVFPKIRDEFFDT